MRTKGITVKRSPRGYYVADTGEKVSGYYDKEDDAYQARADYIKATDKAFRSQCKASRALNASLGFTTEVIREELAK